jgi:hypothetical protein
LLSDVLNSTISICLKLKKKSKTSGSFDTFMEEESIIALELGFLASKIKKKIVVF